MVNTASDPYSFDDVLFSQSLYEGTRDWHYKERLRLSNLLRDPRYNTASKLDIYTKLRNSKHKNNSLSQVERASYRRKLEKLPPTFLDTKIQRQPAV